MEFGQRQSDLNEYEKKDKVEALRQRINLCPDMSWASIVCSKCGRVHKLNATKMSCYCPYCQDPECIENRRRLAFTSLKSLKIHSRNLLHIVIGFPRVEKFSKGEGRRHQKIFKRIENRMKKLGTPVRWIQCRDVNGFPQDLYVHYHMANIPVKDWRLFRRNLFLVREKMNCFSVKFLGYRRRLKIYKYFSKRVAGIFQNERDPNTFGYDKLMSLQEYHECFYRTKKIRLVGIKPTAKPSVLALLLDNQQFFCQFCGADTFKIVPNDMIDELNNISVPPPPKSITNPVAVVECNNGHYTIVSNDTKFKYS